jgi:hypothetical protein
MFNWNKKQETKNEEIYSEQRARLQRMHQAAAPVAAGKSSGSLKGAINAHANHGGAQLVDARARIEQVAEKYSEQGYYSMEDKHGLAESNNFKFWVRQGVVEGEIR